MNNKLLNISFFISIIGLGLLYLLFINSSEKFVEAELIDENFIGKSIKSEIRFSSLKEYNKSIIIYPKKVHFKLVAFGKQKIEAEENDIIEFSGIVDEDKYGLTILIDELKIRK
jgi:hypothetical protein